MTDLAVVAPALLYVRWSCRRCGHTGGMARTTIPFDLGQGASISDFLMQEARRKIVRVHQKRQACIASVSDIHVERCNPHGDIL